jgi:iron-sulfur cluster repair protein YtfE (RIC family)
MSGNENRPMAPYDTASVTAADNAITAQRGDVDLTIMLAMHAAFRRDLTHLAHAAGRTPADLEDPPQRAAVLAGWEVFKTQLHNHHTAEDHDLWPRMRQHLADRPDDLAVLDAMENEHRHIDPLLAAIDSAFADHDHGHERLGDAVDAVATRLPEHLAHEERDALPLVDRSLTAKDWREFTTLQRRKNGIRGAAQLFPWMLESTSPDRVRNVLHTLPPPLRVVYRRVWQPRYTRHDHWESVAA